MPAARPANHSTTTPTPVLVAEILRELESLGKASYKSVLVNNHEVNEPCFGVAISELKKIQKRFKGNHQLALALFDTGNYDAMYLAGMLADADQMKRQDLLRWVGQARGGCLPGTTVPGVAAGSTHGWKLAHEWIQSADPRIAGCGWATLSSIVSVKPDDQLDLARLRELLLEVKRSIHGAPDRVRYQMNSFVIATACFVVPLTGIALEIAEQIGKVTADLGNNSCQVPHAPDYIRKVQSRGTIGKKRKSTLC